MIRSILFGLVLVVLSLGALVATNEFSPSEIEGRNLVRQILDLGLSETFTNKGVLKIRGPDRKPAEIPLTFQTAFLGTNWIAIYRAFPTNAGGQVGLAILRRGIAPNQYSLVGEGNDSGFSWKIPSEAETMIPFAGSDFWVADLGLEFFHWPAQKVLKREMKRGQACKVLESTNPNPSTNGYSRVVSWIGNDTLGLVQAEAYDAKGRLLKEFKPKEFKKVNGQWQVQEMEIRNVRTGSRTRLEFYFDPR